MVIHGQSRLVTLLGQVSRRVGTGDQCQCFLAPGRRPSVSGAREFEEVATQPLEHGLRKGSMGGVKGARGHDELGEQQQSISSATLPDESSWANVHAPLFPEQFCPWGHGLRYKGDRTPSINKLRRKFCSHSGLSVVAPVLLYHFEALPMGSGRDEVIAEPSRILKEAKSNEW